MFYISVPYLYTFAFICMRNNNMFIYSLCLGDILERVVPMFQQISFLIIIHSHIEVVKHARKEVIYFSCDIQNMTHTVNKKIKHEFICNTERNKRKEEYSQTEPMSSYSVYTEQ